MIRANNTSMTNVIIGCDHRGLGIFKLIMEYLEKSELYRLTIAHHHSENSVDYPDVAAKVARAVSEKQADFGILICGTGIGMCVVANKFPGVRAAPCHNEVVAEICRKHNDSNVLCLSGDMLGERSSVSIVEHWLTTPFSGGHHQERLEKIKGLESRLYQRETV